MDYIEVELVNWRKHQRKDVKKPSWFALDNRILEDAKLFGLTDSEWKALLYVFCQASQQHATDTVRLSFAHAARVCEIPNKTLRSVLEKLEHAGVTRTLRPRDEHVTPQDKTRQDTTRQDKTLPANTRPVRSDPQKANAFVRAYCDRFKLRWGENPQILGKDAGIAKRLAKDLGQDRFEYLLDAFFQMPDAWLVKVKHPLAAFETKLNEVVVFAESGQFHTQRQAREADSSATNAMLLAKVERGEL